MALRRARFDGNAPSSLFCELELQLAKRVSLYLKPFRVSRIQDLSELVEAYPLCYLSLILPDTMSSSDREILLSWLRTETRLTLDIAMQFHQYDLKELNPTIQAISSSLSVEAVRLEIYQTDAAGIRALTKLLQKSGNKAHMLCLHCEQDNANTEHAAGERARCITELLQKDGNVLSLDLTWSGQNIPSFMLATCGFFGALSNAAGISYLRLRDTGLDAAAAILLAKALATHRSLKLLHISRNPIKDEGLTAIAMSLKVNTSLRALLFAETLAAEIGGIAVAESLRINSKLEFLAFKDESLGADCGRAFAEMLVVNTSLLGLSLDFCDLGAEGCRSFSAALAANKTLRTLRLNYNGCTPVVEAELTRIAVKEGTLERLELSDTNVIKKQSTSPSSLMLMPYKTMDASYSWHLRAQA